MSRLTWPEIWIALAGTVAARSPDPKFKVGCVLVTDDNARVLAIGYNGDEAGGPHVRDSMETGQSGFVHAEANMIAKAPYPLPAHTVYLTHSPCKVCARMLINAGVKVIRYREVYDSAAIELLQARGIDIASTREEADERSG